MVSLISRRDEKARQAAGKAVAVILGTALAASLATVPALAQSDLVNVSVNNARIVRLPEKTQTVVVGNPVIADVTVQKNGNMVVTGKSYGLTNLIALDGSGNIIAESKIRVQPSMDSLVVVQRGMDKESFSCTPTCEPSISLGDSKGFFEDAIAGSERRNALAVPQK